jgi:hypothetical protein
MARKKLCSCGSGKPRRQLCDAAGIFCCYVCDDCEAERRKGYRPEIFEPGTPYAASGNEADIEEVLIQRIDALLRCFRG